MKAEVKEGAGDLIRKLRALADALEREPEVFAVGYIGVVVERGAGLDRHGYVRHERVVMTEGWTSGEEHATQSDLVILDQVASTVPDLVEVLRDSILTSAEKRLGRKPGASGN